jgi:hypothetical protein
MVVQILSHIFSKIFIVAIFMIFNSNNLMHNFGYVNEIFLYKIARENLTYSIRYCNQI